MAEKITILTGAGMSADSGLSTFRDNNGFWEKYDLQELATPEAWKEKPEKVLDFYNERRRQIADVEPNEAHLALADLEKYYEVSIITQNIDDLHERAGSSSVLHLHGLITKARSDKNPQNIIDIGYEDINIGDRADDGEQLRPHVVWFGEPVMNLQQAAVQVNEADIFIVIGTSLKVYPAAGLIGETSPNTEKYIIDPSNITLPDRREWTYYQEKAVKGTPDLVNQLVENHNKY